MDEVIKRVEAYWREALRDLEHGPHCASRDMIEQTLKLLQALDRIKDQSHD